jgi:D-arabinose 1-dehydrogenase-like Zn-dependent alcohol dehydrogenase
MSLITKGTSVHGWPSGSPVDCQDAIETAKLQGIKTMIETFPLDKAQEALDKMMAGKTRFRGVLVME